METQNEKPKLVLVQKRPPTATEANLTPRAAGRQRAAKRAGATRRRKARAEQVGRMCPEAKDLLRTMVLAEGSEADSKQYAEAKTALLTFVGVFPANKDMLFGLQSSLEAIHYLMADAESDGDDLRLLVSASYEQE